MIRCLLGLTIAYSLGLVLLVAVVVAAGAILLSVDGAVDSDKVPLAGLVLMARLFGAADTPFSEMDFSVLGGVFAFLAAGCCCAFTRKGAANKANVTRCFIVWDLV